jgi:branched-chain amino acid transport system permease protein
VGPTTAPARRTLPWLAALLGVLLAAAIVFFGSGTANAAPGDDQTKTDFYFAGVITFEEKPVPDVVVSVEGNGFKAETETDADGKWRLYVPEKGTYKLTIAYPGDATHLAGTKTFTIKIVT